MIRSRRKKTVDHHRDGSIADSISWITPFEADLLTPSRRQLAPKRSRLSIGVAGLVAVIVLAERPRD